MYQIVKMTDKEKMTMYMKLSKKEIIGMIIECNKVLDMITPILVTEPEQQKCSGFFPIFTTTSSGCLYCGKMEYEH